MPGSHGEGVRCRQPPPPSAGEGEQTQEGPRGFPAAWLGKGTPLRGRGLSPQPVSAPTGEQQRRVIFNQLVLQGELIDTEL